MAKAITSKKPNADDTPYTATPTRSPLSSSKAKSRLAHRTIKGRASLEVYEAFKAMQSINAQMSKLRKQQEQIKQIVAEAFTGNTLKLLTPDGDGIICKKEIQVAPFMNPGYVRTTYDLELL